MTLFQILLLIYSIIASIIFLVLVLGKRPGKMTIEYPAPEAYALKAMLTEMGLFALIALFWPLFVVGIKVYRNK